MHSNQRLDEQRHSRTVNRHQLLDKHFFPLLSLNLLYIFLFSSLYRYFRVVAHIEIRVLRQVRQRRVNPIRHILILHQPTTLPQSLRHIHPHIRHFVRRHRNHGRHDHSLEALGRHELHQS